MPFTIVRNDITKMNVDAIVNTANEEPIYSNGTDTAVYEAAGAEELLQARRKIGRLKQGEVAITPGFHLMAKYIIHAVRPYYYGGNRGEEEKLRSCYAKSLQLALEHGCKSIAFPLIATGNYKYPKEEGLRVALSEINNFLLKEDMMIYLVVFDPKSTKLSGKLFTDIEFFIDENYVEKSMQNEYATAAKFGHREKPCDVYEEAGGKVEIIVNDTVHAMIAKAGETFQQQLFRLIDEKGCSEVSVYKKANIDKKLFHKIKSKENYQPSKPTVLAFAIALELDLEETNELLKTAGFALSPGNRYDLIIKYFIERKIYDIYQINSVLFDYNEKCFGC